MPATDEIAKHFCRAQPCEASARCEHAPHRRAGARSASSSWRGQSLGGSRRVLARGGPGQGAGHPSEGGAGPRTVRRGGRGGGGGRSRMLAGGAGGPGRAPHGCEKQDAGHGWRESHGCDRLPGMDARSPAFCHGWQAMDGRATRHGCAPHHAAWMLLPFFLGMDAAPHNGGHGCPTAFFLAWMPGHGWPGLCSMDAAPKLDGRPGCRGGPPQKNRRAHLDAHTSTTDTDCKHAHTPETAHVTRR